MPKRSSNHSQKAPKKREGTPHDFTVVARRVVEQAIGETLDGKPLPDKDAGKNPAAVALGKLGGAKGGRRRAANLSKKRLSEIGRRGASARWNQKTEKPSKN